MFLCTDKGRSINNADKDWPETLTGRPRQAYEFWRDQLRPAGYRLKAMIVEWPGGLPATSAFSSSGATPSAEPGFQSQGGNDAASPRTRARPAHGSDPIGVREVRAGLPEPLCNGPAELRRGHRPGHQRVARCGSATRPVEVWRDVTLYSSDFVQRSLLFWDTLRRRGNNWLEHEKAGKPPLLAFDWEMVADGRLFQRPVNYALVRIPPSGVATDRDKRPFVIIDPRAGHGPGIEGSRRTRRLALSRRAIRCTS